ncbi:hypothetical protein [Hydrogenivirga sp. 128-5-R1-1]|uniref:hypothetical protein n=1 Tax=Hydrogenivirga sp. 128-5-R1-1 TaxID=392423 RepID=UPI00015EFB95|nr:hypothetical protein [Hydrogenivirga sp. 128-5-R1-1]EDP73374.1 hypothetical protein HG1285_11717 [Hydrogenivirga sp. 128-5-R1-1]
MKIILFEYLEYFNETLEKIGINLTKIGKNTAYIKKAREVKPINIETKEYPYFPTDLQAQMMVLLSFADGTSKIKENIFENRFMHADELNRLGANIKVDTKNNTAIIKGVKKLEGAKVKATDLRASAAMVIAGLASEGITEIEEIYHLYRGYEHIDQKLRNIGAEVYKKGQ